MNAGNSTWSGNTGNFVNDLALNGGTFNNTGTFTDTNAFSDQMTGSGTFNNNGTFNKQNNTLTNVGVDFNNTGTVNVNAGTLRLQGGGTHSGTFALANGSTLDLNAGTHNLNAVTTSTFSSTLDLSGNGSKVISGGRTVNAGNSTWSGNTGNFFNDLALNGGIFNNTGTFTDTNAFSDQMTGGGTFNNKDTFNKQNNTLTNVGVDFNNTGTVNVNAGVFNVAHAFTNAGTVNIGAGGTFRSSCGGADCFGNTGIMQGNGTIQTPVNNELINRGMINPGDSIGHLTIDGNLHQAANGAVNFELAGLHNFDQLTVTGDATLGGELGVWNLGYTPVVGDSFVVATFDDRLANSTFSSVIMHGFGSGVNFDVLYHAHDVTLAVTAVPEPEQYLMFLAGLGLMGAMARRRRG